MLQLILLLTSSEGEYSPSFVFRRDVQSEIDSLKKSHQKDSIFRYRIKPFNPNYISDYKGYALGLTPDQIDRLHVYRAKGRFVNSAKEFQRVTQISDTILKRIASYFKFPEWVKERKKIFNSTPKKVEIRDINKVTARELTSVYGIGKVLSGRIVKYRKTLGGYSIDEQLYEVYGIKKEVIKRVLERYRVMSSPQKLNINEVSAKRLSELPYLSYRQALKIIAYRTQSGNIDSWDDLKVLSDIDSLSLNRLSLYFNLGH